MNSPFDKNKNQNDGIIVNSAPFEEDFTPDRILERDGVIDTYQKYLQPILDERGIHNIFVRGPTGVGKTAITKRILSFLDEDTTEIGVPFDYVYVNVNAKSRYETLLAIANSLYPNREYKAGTNTSSLRRDIYRRIDEVEGYFLLVIDECDKLSEDGEDEFLYEFPRARSNGTLDDTKAGIIGISNSLTYGRELSPRIKSSLTEREIEYEPYDGPEIESILSYYADLALREDSYTQGVISYISAVVADDTGDARMALDLLQLAIEVARDEGEARVVEQHARIAWEQLDEQSTLRRVRNILTGQQALILGIITELDLVRSGTVTVDRIYDRYVNACETLGKNKLSERRVRDHIKTLEMYGFVTKTEENEGYAPDSEGGGRRFLYELDVEPEPVLEGLSYHSATVTAIEESFDVFD